MRKTIKGIPAIEYHRKYREDNRDKINQRTRELYSNNIDEFREKNRKRQAKVTAALRDKVYELLGGATCRKCGFSDKRALQIDHIDGSGAKERASGATNNLQVFYRKIIRGCGDGYQVLCANCNWIKRHENGECGGKRKAE